ncbi:acyl-CoA dehydrogenase family protein [Dactylosporangium sp. NPDC000244]|uniref:acyl-CoA dehydrogenase family protein n=1 Tax=Dactylosporangium sp. NPDC000244 TaxID=3154365 RepID=UPI003317595B
MRAAIDGAALAPDGWATLSKGGYLDIGVPEAVGGLGRTIDLVVMLEEAGRSLLAVPLLPAVLASQTQIAAGVHREDYRRSPAGFSTAEGVVEDGRCFVERAHVLGGLDAATFTLVVQGPDRAWISVVDRDADGVEVLERATVIDPSRPVPALRFQGAAAVESRAIALDDLERIMASARVCLAADLVGTAAGALDAAIEHVLQRQQFGQAIGAFQAVKHQLADAYVSVEKARSLTLGAALRLVAGALDDVPTRDCLLANAVAAEAAVQVAARFTQLMGAMGVTFEADCHLFLRRAHQSAGLLGTPDDLFMAAARIERREAR